MRVLALFLTAAFALAPLASTAAPSPTKPVSQSLPPPGPATVTWTMNGKPQNSIEISSFQWGVGRGIGSPMGGSKDRESSAPSVSEIAFSFHSSKTNPLACATGEHIKTVNLTTNTHKIVLTDVVVLTCRISSGGDRPTKSVSLSFRKIEWS